VGTFASGDGAPAGEYQVIIVQHFDAYPVRPDRRESVAPVVHDEKVHGDVRVAAEYADYAKSPLWAKVEPGVENKYDFVVTRPRKKLPAQAGK
jgi:hypothetical protein